MTNNFTQSSVGVRIHFVDKNVEFGYVKINPQESEEIDFSKMHSVDYITLECEESRYYQSYIGGLL